MILISQDSNRAFFPPFIGEVSCGWDDNAIELRSTEGAYYHLAAYDSPEQASIAFEFFLDAVRKKEEVFTFPDKERIAVIAEKRKARGDLG